MARLLKDDVPLKTDKTFPGDYSFRFDEVIGKGVYGKVFATVHKTTGKSYATKIYQDENDVESLHREIRVLRAVKHKNVVDLADVFVYDDVVYLVMERGKETLFDYRCREKNGFTLETYHRLLKGIIDGLVACHEKGYGHFDLKPDNVIIDEEGVPKLIDFNLSRHVIPMVRTCEPYFFLEVCSVPYRPPELLLGSSYPHLGIDVWSVGMLMTQMILGNTFINGKNEMDQLLALLDTMGLNIEDQWPDVVTSRFWSPLLPFDEANTAWSEIEPFRKYYVGELLVATLVMNPRHRPTMYSVQAMHESVVNAYVVRPPGAQESQNTVRPPA